jgi:LmbE family N-acetylglucosaminyl deacetylase
VALTMDAAASPPQDAFVERLRGARILLFTPHPDDESLAAGGLVQAALGQGARVDIVQVTDGDNNPWPQRWLERRLFIGAEARRRWGLRRRAEVKAALGELGLPATALQCLGWPDMGVTACLRDGGVAAIDAFAARIAAASADVIVLPALGDRHPDHSACHVLVRLALARLQAASRPLPSSCLEYLVHGRDGDAGTRVDIALDAAMQARKRAAVLAHQSQVALSRGRLLSRVGPRESFRCVAFAAGEPKRELQLPWRPSVAMRPWLRLTLAHADGVQAWPLAAAPLARDRDGGWRLCLPDTVGAYGPLFVKLETRLPSPWIFDHWGWYRLDRTPVAASAAPARAAP